MSVRLPERITIVSCKEHHFKNGDKTLKACAVCGLATEEYVKYKQKKIEAEANPEAFEDWVVKVYNDKLECKDHKHKVKKVDDN